LTVPATGRRGIKAAITNVAARVERVAMFNLGLLLANRLDPPQLDEARTWLTRAPNAGHTRAMSALEGPQ
jgi:TPR repeat protein